MSKLCGWLAAAGGLLVAALIYMVGQRDKAREQAKAAKVKAATSDANREADNVARRAQQAAREKANEKQREDDSRPSGERPTGSLRKR